MIIPLLYSLQRMSANLRARQFLEKTGLYPLIKRIYSTLCFFIGRKGLKIKIRDVSAKFIVSCPSELSFFHSLGYEGKFLKELLSKIDAQTVFYDVGAYEGLYSLCAAKYRIRPKAVYCFEPDPLNFKRLRENIALNAAGVVAFPVALGTENGAVEMSVEAGGRGSPQSSLIRKRPQSTLVRLVKGDDWVVEKKMPPPTIIKIDVEGYEFNVLTGLRETIERVRPIIFLEVHPAYLKKLGQDRECVFNFLKNFNYKIINFPLSQRSEQHYICVP